MNNIIRQSSVSPRAPLRRQRQLDSNTFDGFDVNGILQGSRPTPTPKHSFTMKSLHKKFIFTSAVALLAASTGWAQLPSYSQDFESLDQTSPTVLGDDGWLVGANVFDQSGNFIYNYFAFPAPNGGPSFSAVTNGWGGANQGAQALVVYNDYNNGDHSWANIEANFFREYVLDASDVGRSMVFNFDGKLGDIQPPTTAAAFIKVLDPFNGYSVSEYQSVDTTNLTVNWETFTLSTEIRADQVGHIFQIGFMNTTTNWTPSGVGYDNISLNDLVLGPDDCGGATAIAGDGVFAFDATTATTGAEGQNEYNCYSFGSSIIDNDLWFEWTADTDGTVNVSTCSDATADTRIAAYPGNSCPVDGSSLACNDDADGCTGFTSAMDFACTSGSAYMIQVGHFPGTTGGIGNVTITQTATPTGPGTAYCFGDGSGTACPIANGGAGEGCANSTGSGAVLAASGSDSASADDLVLSTSNLPDNEPGLYFQGNNSVNGGNGITFGDGLRCAGFEAKRLEVQTSAGGSSATAGSIVTKGLVNAGDTKFYQLWYRDGAGFNTSNGLEITWTL